MGEGRDVLTESRLAFLTRRAEKVGHPCSEKPEKQAAKQAGLDGAMLDSVTMKGTCMWGLGLIVRLW